MDFAALDIKRTTFSFDRATVYRRRHPQAIGLLASLYFVLYSAFVFISSAFYSIVLHTVRNKNKQTNKQYSCTTNTLAVDWIVPGLSLSATGGEYSL